MELYWTFSSARGQPRDGWLVECRQPEQSDQLHIVASGAEQMYLGCRFARMP